MSSMGLARYREVPRVLNFWHGTKMRVYCRRMSSSSTPTSSTSAAIVPTGASFTPTVEEKQEYERQRNADENEYNKHFYPLISEVAEPSSSTGSSSAAAVVRPPLSLEEREKALWLIHFRNPEEDEFIKTLESASPENKAGIIKQRRMGDFIKLLEKAKIPPEEYDVYVQQWRKTPYTTTIDIINILEKNDPVGASEGGRRRSTRHKQHKKRPRKHRKRCSTRRR